MIKTIADLLRELMVKEAAELDEEPVKHGPTIGAMYEGLARDILDTTLAGLAAGAPSTFIPCEIPVTADSTAVPVMSDPSHA